MFASEASPPALTASFSQKSTTAGFVMRASLRARKALSVKTRGTSISVAGSAVSSMRSRSAFRMYCSNMGPIVSGGNSLLKIPCNSFTTKVFSSGRMGSTSSILRPTGRMRSPGSSTITSFCRSSGMSRITASTRSPCGSMMAAPLPRSMSSASMFASSTDFPVPV